MKPTHFKEKEEPDSCLSCMHSQGMCPDGYICDKHDFYIADSLFIMLCICLDHKEHEVQKHETKY